MKKILLLVFYILLLITLEAKPTLYASINSIGYRYEFSTPPDSTKTIRCDITYGENTNYEFKALEPSLININGKKELRGSIFNLKPNTKYFIRFKIMYGDGSFDLFYDEITTLSETIISPTSLIKYVSPTGSGTAYTLASPGNLKTLLAAGLSCGTTVLLKGGTYSTGDMQLNLLQDCSSGAPIIIMAAPNEKPIIDGGDYTQYTWTKHTSDTNLYYTTIKPELEYNSLCLFDSLRLYPYAYLTPNSIDPSYPCLTKLNFDLSGFYRNANLVYIKTLDNKNPNNATIVFSKYFYCLQVQGNRRKNFVYIKGITFKNYGKGSCSKDIFGNPTCYPSFTLSFEYANNIIIDSCNFEFCNLPLSFAHNSNNNIIQNCSFIDGVGQWSHGAFKQTRDVSFLERGSSGRYLEYSSINQFADDTVQKGFIIRNNYVRGSIGGLVGQRITGFERIEETDIYNNKINYCYNGINADGGSINTRIWNNEIDHCSVGLSFISGTYGPNYVFRNNIHHIIERKNHHFDIFFNDCNNVLSTKIWGTGIKLNASSKTATPPEMYFINNTFHSLDTLGFCMYLWNSTWKKIYSRNNIFYSEGMSSLFFDGPKDDTTYSFNSKGDCYFNKANGNAATVQPTNGIPLCYTYSTGTQLGTELKNISKGNDVNIVNDVNVNPEFINVFSDLHLKSTSALVDAGFKIDGFNEFKGIAPDIGAYETSVSGINKPTSNNNPLVLYPNPTTGILTVQWDQFTTELKYEITSILGQVILVGKLDTPLTNIDLRDLNPGIYFIRCGDVSAKFIKQ